jgi:ribosomal protein L13
LGLIDANDQVLGRVAVKAANLLRGKEKAIFTPHVDTGDFVVVINAEKVRVTGKKDVQKSYMSFSGYVGGHKSETFRGPPQTHPELLVEKAIWGMVPAQSPWPPDDHQAEGLLRDGASARPRRILNRSRSRRQVTNRQPESSPKMPEEIAATGRRKTAVARVRMLPGNGQFIVNNRSLRRLLQDRIPPEPRHSPPGSREAR